MVRVAYVKIGHFHTYGMYFFWDVQVNLYVDEKYKGHYKLNAEVPMTVELLRLKIRDEFDCDQVYIQENLLFPMPYDDELCEDWE